MDVRCTLFTRSLLVTKYVSSFIVSSKIIQFMKLFADTGVQKQEVLGRTDYICFLSHVSVYIMKLAGTINRHVESSVIKLIVHNFR